MGKGATMGTVMRHMMTVKQFCAFVTLIIPFLLILALAGCGFTTQGNAVRQGVATYGAQAMDEGLVNAEWFVCKAASVGSIQRRYGADPTKAQAWKALCLVDTTNPVPLD